MDAASDHSKQWSSTHAYIFALVCLLLGTVAGYLLRSPKTAVAAPKPLAAASVTPSNPPTGDQMKHMAEKAAEPLVAALQKDPNNAEVMAKLGSVYFRTQQFPLAVEYYERAAKAKPTPEVYVSLSNSYHYAGADDRAIETLNRALQLDPKSANALFNLGMLQWQAKNDPKAAIAMWERLLKTNPDHPRRADVENMIAKARKHMDTPAETKN